MNIGTKSILYGAHCFFIHPWFVAWAWLKLYGFPLDPRLWFAFFLHDIGYLGKPNMDGKEGESHPELGARIMGRLFGWDWYAFTLFHSRYYAKQCRQGYSRLCVADKLAISLTPSWLYLPMVNLTGEIEEYMHANHARTPASSDCQEEWLTEIKCYTRAWALEHKELKEDLWT